MTLIIENQSFVEPTVMEHKRCPVCFMTTLKKIDNKFLHEYSDVDPKREELWFCEDVDCENWHIRPIPRRAIV